MAKRSATLERSTTHALLERNLADLTEQYALAQAELRLANGHDANDRAGDDTGDAGVRTMEHDRQQSLIETLIERMDQVTTALAQLDAGGYGTCERCGEPIPPQRLEVFPAATYCMPCKERAERRR